jgi:hypothetical protein
VIPERLASPDSWFPDRRCGMAVAVVMEFEGSLDQYDQVVQSMGLCSTG